MNSMLKGGLIVGLIGLVLGLMSGGGMGGGLMGLLAGGGIGAALGKFTHLFGSDKTETPVATGPYVPHKPVYERVVSPEPDITALNTPNVDRNTDRQIGQ